MAYSLTGDGPIDLVLVPGFVSNLEAVFDLPAIERGVKRLASFARVISFAKPGTGLSDPIEGPRTLEHRDPPGHGGPHRHPSHPRVPAGFSPDLAALFVEFNQALSEGRLHPLKARNESNTTPTEFEEFAAELCNHRATSPVIHGYPRRPTHRAG